MWNDSCINLTGFVIFPSAVKKINAVIKTMCASSMTAHDMKAVVMQLFFFKKKGGGEQGKLAVNSQTATCILANQRRI